MKWHMPAYLRSSLTEHALLTVAVLALAAVFLWQDVLWRWDNLLYDAQLSLWSRPAPQDIIIVAIDDQSLEDLERWPWPRSLHAKLLRRITAEAPRAIGMDILFSEPDTRGAASDAELAAAIKASNRVALPVYMTQSSTGAVPLEALPLPQFTEHAAALGHVNIDIGRDGIARRVYLREGIGKPHWPHYALALLKLIGKKPPLVAAIERQVADDTNDYSPMLWNRQYPYLIPYAGPPEHFTRIGYSQVLAGQYPRNLFHNKIVLIGVTAEGMGDAFPTPLSAHSRNMAGVEIVANIFDGLRNNLHIEAVQNPWLTLITLLLIALPMLVYPYVKPATTLFVLFGALGFTLLLVAILLWLFAIWIPVSTLLLFQLLSYPLWSWRRLDLALRHVNTELRLLEARQQALSLRRARHIDHEIHFIQQFIDIKSWVLQDENDQPLLGEGTAPRCNLGRIDSARWTIDGHRYWTKISYQGKPCLLGLSLAADEQLPDESMQLLNNLLTVSPANDIAPSITDDIWQTRIKRLKVAGIEHEQLRRIIDDSLSGMADGILICNGRGQIMLSNRRAGWYLCADDDAELNQRSLSELLAQIDIREGGDWHSLLHRVLFTGQRQLARAQHHSGRDLMIEISPLGLLESSLDGFIINLSDISRLKTSERQRNQILDFLSHDLRSPLSSMLAMIELARNKSSLAEMRAMLNVMESNTEKTLHLAEQFLQLSRASTEQKLAFHEVDFNNIALNAIDRLWPLSNKKQTEIVADLQQEECWTFGEGDLLERALINLLSNAIKYSPKNSTVTLRVTLSHNEICCCVIDQGCGIAEQDIPHLFQLFKRAHGNGVERIQGIGLGLAFVDAVAKRHQGHVFVKSTLGKGSSFCLIIPLQQARDSANSRTPENLN